MATAVQIQNCKKILHEEMGQDDVFDELLELTLSKINLYKSAEELFKDPEIVAFASQKNIPIDVDISPVPTLEESFREEIRRFKQAERISKLVSLKKRMKQAERISKLVSLKKRMTKIKDMHDKLTQMIPSLKEQKFAH